MGRCLHTWLCFMLSAAAWLGAAVSLVPVPNATHSDDDGLGRLIRTQSPFTVDLDPFAPIRTERFYYDGIRRIQEVYIDPVLTLEAAMTSGNSGVAAAAQSIANQSAEELDGSATPVQLEQVQTGGPTPNTLVENQPITFMYLAREYIWGPGDGGLDELLVQYDEARNPWWIAQDAGLDVIAQFDLGGSGGTARVVGEWTYDAYGQVAGRRVPGTICEPHAGQKGLFFDRLDAQVVDEFSYQETPRLVTDAVGHYHVRNRVLSPKLGRWLQADPNATGQVTVAASRMGEAAPMAVAARCNLAMAFKDGANRMAYVGSNPACRSDELGLFFAIDALESVVESCEEFAQGAQQVGVLNMVKLKLMTNISGIYAAQLMLADAIYCEGTGQAPNPFSTELQVMSTLGNMGASSELLELSAATFRQNLLRVTGLSESLMSGVWQAHHVIPQECRFLLEKLGIGHLVDNPLLGQWIETSAHTAMHQDGYNEMWKTFLGGLVRENPSKSEATSKILEFIKTEVVPNFSQYGMRPPPF